MTDNFLQSVGRSVTLCPFVRIYLLDGAVAPNMEAGGVRGLRLRKWGMAGLAVVTTGAIAFGVLSTAGVASAQTPPGGGQGQGQGQNRQRGLEMLAQQLGVTVEQLRTATREVRNQLIDQAVAAGRITKEQGDRLKQGPRMGPGNQQGQGNRGPRNQGGMRGFDRSALTDIYATLAGSMGLTKEQLTAELRAGKSLADVGAAHGRTPDMLKNTILTQMKADLQAQVAAGKLNQQTADRILAGADRMLLRVINAKRGQFQQGQMGPRFGGQPRGTPQGPR